MDLATLILASLLTGSVVYAIWGVIRTAVGIGNLPRVPSITACVARALAPALLQWLTLAVGAWMLAGVFSQTPEWFRYALVGIVLLAGLPCVCVAARAPARRWAHINGERRLFLGATILLLGLLCPPILALAVAAVVARRLLAWGHTPMIVAPGLLIEQLADDIGLLLASVLAVVQLVAGALAGLFPLLAFLLVVPRVPCPRELWDSPIPGASASSSPACSPRGPPALA